MWLYRERLNYYEKLRRSLYEIMRDSLELRLIKISLIDSFNNYLKNDVEYSFVDKSELRPKSKKMEKESELFNTFIIIFCEGVVDPSLKNYIRFFPENKVIKRNLDDLPNLMLHKNFKNNIKYFDTKPFLDFVEGLSSIDYALLIQQDPSVKKKNRYALTHFHVKVDWPITDAAEDLAKHLRYIQGNLYENGDEYARIIQNKLFEYYGSHYSAGGRRTAALIASQLLRRLSVISTIYISSSESRTMVKYSERGVSKFFLIQLTDDHITALASKEKMDVERFKNAYLFPGRGYYVGVSEAVYDYTEYSRPPEDGKVRKIKPAYNWLKVIDEFLHPRPDSSHLRPINYRWVYSPE